MVHWAWLIFTFFSGFIFGILLIALVEAERASDSEKKQTKDD